MCLSPFLSHQKQFQKVSEEISAMEQTIEETRLESVQLEGKFLAIFSQKSAKVAKIWKTWKFLASKIPKVSKLFSLKKL